MLILSPSNVVSAYLDHFQKVFTPLSTFSTGISILLIVGCVSACLGHHQSHGNSDLHFPSRGSVAGKKASPISLWLTLDAAEYPRVLHLTSISKASLAHVISYRMLIRQPELMLLSP
jgi:hypothetical protein